jgi:hypothetical protein
VEAGGNPLSLTRFRLLGGEPVKQSSAGFRQLSHFSIRRFSTKQRMLLVGSVELLGRRSEQNPDRKMTTGTSRASLVI